MRFHRFDPPQDQLPRPSAPRMTVAQFERTQRAPLLLRAQHVKADDWKTRVIRGAAGGSTGEAIVTIEVRTHAATVAQVAALVDAAPALRDALTAARDALRAACKHDAADSASYPLRRVGAE